MIRPQQTMMQFAAQPGATARCGTLLQSAARDGLIPAGDARVSLDQCRACAVGGDAMLLPAACANAALVTQLRLF